MGPPCTSQSCKKSRTFKCNEITEEQRETIHTHFWSDMSWDQKKVYVSSLVSEQNTKRKKGSGTESRRSSSFVYKLRTNNDGNTYKVCKRMFLSTFSLGEWCVRNWVMKSHSGMHSSKLSTNEKRRKTTNDLKNVEKEFLYKFFDELPKLPSHYCRSSSNKLYLEPIFGNSISSLYEEYRKRCTHDENYQLEPLSRHSFDKVGKELNVGFSLPKKDMCDTCISYGTKNLSEEEYNIHILRKNEARSEKEKDKSKGEKGECVVLTQDLQAVKVCPILNASALYYKTKLCCHNFTVFDLNTRNAKCYWFDETQANLSSNTFSTCIIDYLLEKASEAKEIVIWSDNCVYQNKNSTLSNALLTYSIEKKVTIYQKFLEKGHTQMEVDSVHACIEKALKNKFVYVPDDFCRSSFEARKKIPYEIKRVSFDFVKDFDTNKIYTSIRPGKCSSDPTVNDIKVIKYTSNGIEVKTSFSGEWIPLPLKRGSSNLMNSAKLSNFNQLNKEPIKIKHQKWIHLQQLKQVIPKDYHTFYDNLPHYDM